MKPQRPISRRKFLAAASWLLLFPLACLAWRMERRHKELHQPELIILAEPSSDGVFFPHPGVILHKSGNRVQAFSSSCPHLGCRIREWTGDYLQCPCHGSRFDAEGKVIQGPAGTSLRALEIRVGEEKGFIALRL